MLVILLITQLVGWNWFKWKSARTKWFELVHIDLKVKDSTEIKK